jgi:hypothetical protein
MSLYRWLALSRIIRIIRTAHNTNVLWQALQSAYEAITWLLGPRQILTFCFKKLTQAYAAPTRITIHSRIALKCVCPERAKYALWNKDAFNSLKLVWQQSFASLGIRKGHPALLELVTKQREILPKLIP